MAYVYPEEYSDLATSQLKLDVTPELKELEKDVTIFTTFLMNLGPSAKSGGTSYKHEWEEQDPEDLDDTLNGSYTTTVTQFTVHNGSYFTVGDTIKDTDTGDVFLVTAESSNVLTVTDIGAASAVGGGAAGDNVKIIGSAFGIGTEKPTPVQKTVTHAYNYMQIFKESFQVAGSVDAATMNINVGERNRLRKIRLATHKKKIERALWFGELKSVAGSSSTNYTYFMKGAIAWAAQNAGSPGTVLTESEFDTWLSDVFYYGGTRRILFADAILNRGLSHWKKGKVEWTPKGENYGLPQMKRYLCSEGILDIVYNRLMKDDFAGYSYAFDPDCIGVIPMDPDSNGTRFNRYWTNVQEEGSDKFEDQYLTELTLEFSNPYRHGYIYGYSSVG